MSGMGEGCPHCPTTCSTWGCAQPVKAGVVLAACGPQLTLAAAQPKWFVAQQQTGARGGAAGGMGCSSTRKGGRWHGAEQNGEASSGEATTEQRQDNPSAVEEPRHLH
jgi:hypothetical protein